VNGASAPGIRLSLTAFAAGLPPPVRAALWMIGSVFAVAVMAILIRHLGTALDPLQVVFLRTLFGLMAMLPWLARQGVGALRTQHIGLHLLRAGLAIIAMVTSFTAMTLMPLAEATALGFTAPIFASVLAVLVLGEPMRLRRWSAVAAGLLGALIVLRPGFAAFQPVALLALAAALTGAVATITLKVMARTERPGTVVTYMTLFTTPLALVPALFVWQGLTAAQLGWAALLGLAGTVAHYCMSRALGQADTTVVVPFDYLRLPVIALMAFLVLGEVPGVWVWLGGAVIASSGIYMTFREARLRAEPTAMAPGPTGRSTG
jgi:drug/metabolite transporter (DMT)-like permease